MGKPKAPQQPAPPDPYVTADAQTQSNLATAIANANLNRINQYTPYGSIEYNVEGFNYDGTPRYSQTTKLSPDQQALLDEQTAQDRQINRIAGGYMGRIEDQMGRPFDMGSLPGLTSNVGGRQFMFGLGDTGQVQGSLPGAGTIATGFDAGPGAQTTFADVGGPRRTIGDAGAIQDSFADVGGPQRALSFDGLSALPGAGDFSTDRQRVEEALFSRLNPEFTRQEDALRTRLANQGIMQGSEAYDRELDALNRSRNDARMQTVLAGGQEQSRLFGLGLSARQQGVSERGMQGQFANSAQAQAFDQAAARGQFANAAQGQRYGQMANTFGAENAAQQQAYAQALGRGQFANQGAAQQFEQNRALAGFGNEAQGRVFDQNLAAGQFANQAQAQRYAQALSSAGLYNDAAAREFSQGLTNANLTNAARQQAIQEQAFLRSLPLNEFSALRSGAQVTMPSFSGIEPVAMQGTPIGDYIGQNYAAQQNIYNQQMAARNAYTQGLFGLGGSLASAAILASDRRLKRDIERIGTTPGGLGVYEYRYLSDNDNAPLRTGVMSDEVRALYPNAVLIGPDGLDRVDYRKVA